MTELAGQLELGLMGGMYGIDGISIPDDDVIHSFGDDEQKAIDYSIQQGIRTTGCTHSALASIAGMNKSQFSLLWSGQRGIPMRRTLQFMRATGTAALLKFYAMNIGMVLKSKEEWGSLVRKNTEKDRRIAELEGMNKELSERLLPYESQHQSFDLTNG